MLSSSIIASISTIISIDITISSIINSLRRAGWDRDAWASAPGTPNLPTEIIPTKIPWLKLSGKSPMDMRIPPLKLRLCSSQTLWSPESS